MTHNTFDFILNEVKEQYNPIPSSHGGFDTLETKYMLILTIWYLANQCTYREIEETFGVAKSFAHKCIQNMINIINKIAKKFIKWPSIQELLNDEKEFRKFANFPGAVGALDGCLIKIKAPNINQRDYLDRHSNHSVNLIAICDSEMKFIFINAGFPGSAHDSRAFRYSNFENNLINFNAKPEGNYHL